MITVSGIVSLIPESKDTIGSDHGVSLGRGDLLSTEDQGQMSVKLEPKGPFINKIISK